jgi:hypothetical protein
MNLWEFDMDSQRFVLLAHSIKDILGLVDMESLDVDLP